MEAMGGVVTPDLCHAVIEYSGWRMAPAPGLVWTFNRWAPYSEPATLFDGTSTLLVFCSKSCLMHSSSNANLEDKVGQSMYIHNLFFEICSLVGLFRPPHVRPKIQVDKLQEIGAWAAYSSHRLYWLSFSGDWRNYGNRELVRLI